MRHVWSPIDWGLAAAAALTLGLFATFGNALTLMLFGLVAGAIVARALLTPPRRRAVPGEGTGPSGPAPHRPERPTAEHPGRGGATGSHAGRRELGSSVFAEALKFADLDPETRSPERYDLIFQVSRRIENRARVLTDQEMHDAETSGWDLDRIGLYIALSVSGRWPAGDPDIHLEHEYKRLAHPPLSLLPLSYALKSYQRHIAQAHLRPSRLDQELLVQIDKLAEDFPHAETAADVRQLVADILAVPARVGAGHATSPAPATDGVQRSTYRQQRARLYEQLMEGGGIKTRTASLHAFTAINEAGDAILQERFEQVQAIGAEPVPSLPAVLETSYGYVPEALRYEAPAGQQITWVFTGPDVRGQRPAEVRFEPALSRTPISFTRTWTHFNAIYFNQRDRLDAGGNPPADQEWLAHTVKSACETLVFRIKFPDGRFPNPQGFHAFAYRPTTTKGPGGQDGEVDADETSWIDAALSVYPDDHVALLNITQPLPGYTYRLAWLLPDKDGDEQKLTAMQAERAERFEQRLGSLTRADSPCGSPCAAAMNALVERVSDRFAGVGGDLRCLLFAYGREGNRGGLREVLANDGRMLHPELVTLGRTLVGRAFRRNAALVFQSVLDQVAQDHSHEPLPSERDRPKPSVAAAIPLLYPEPAGRRIAVLYMATWRPDTCLLELFRTDAARLDFARIVKQWYANDLCAALGMPPAASARAANVVS